MLDHIHILLASSSPRRKDLLQAAGLNFTVKVSAVEEKFPEEMPPEKVPGYLAEKKAKAVQPLSSPDDLILAADTIVLLENQVIGKPRDQEDAAAMLHRLSGKEHRVISGVCLLKGEKMKVFSVVTRVFFRSLTDEQIDFYINNFHPLDKAGAYAIQEWIGLVGVEKIEGDYFNVVGLPVGAVIEEIRLFDES